MRKQLCRRSTVINNQPSGGIRACAKKNQDLPVGIRARTEACFYPPSSGRAPFKCGRACPDCSGARST